MVVEREQAAGHEFERQTYFIYLAPPTRPSGGIQPVAPFSVVHLVGAAADGRAHQIATPPNSLPPYPPPPTPEIIQDAAVIGLGG